MSLTMEEVVELEPGTRIVVTWSGGNGPHEYKVGRWYDEVVACCLPPSEGIRHLLDFIGPASPFTVVTVAKARGES